MNFKFRLDFSSAVTTVANFELCLFFLLGSGCEDFDRVMSAFKLGEFWYIAGYILVF